MYVIKYCPDIRKVASLMSKLDNVINNIRRSFLEGNYYNVPKEEPYYIIRSMDSLLDNIKKCSETKNIPKKIECFIEILEVIDKIKRKYSNIISKFWLDPLFHYLNIHGIYQVYIN